MQAQAESLISEWESKHDKINRNIYMVKEKKKRDEEKLRNLIHPKAKLKRM